MKKKLIKIFILALFIIPIKAYAAGSITVSTGSLSLNVGNSGSFSIIANNAVGRVDISSSNPSVCSVGTASTWVENNSTTVNVNALNAGNCVITVSLNDASTFDEEELHNVYTISVNVTNPPPPTIPSNNNNNPTNNTNNNNNNNNNYVNPITDSKSGNNYLKTISVDTYQLDKVDDTHFKLSVKNKVDKVTITAIPDDNKAKVTGAGNVSLNVGENTFEINVTAENSTVRVYYLTITRKGTEYKLSELEEAIDDLDKVVVTMTDESHTLTSKMLRKIKESNKDVTVNKLDSNNQVVYSWRIKASNIKDTSSDLSLKITDSFEKKEEFDKLTGFRNGLYITLSELGSKFPKDTIIKYNVGNILKGKDNIYLYSYNNSSLQLLKDNLEIVNGYISMTVDKEKQYFLTKALIEGENVKNKIKTINIFFITSVVELFIIIGLLFFIFRKKKEKQEPVDLLNV